MVRRLEQAEATAARVLDAAWHRFSTQPYEAVRLADVAADAGVTVQTLHLRFGTKEGLFTAALQRWMAEQGQRRVDARVGDIEDVVRVLYDNYDDQGEIGLRVIAQEDRIPAIRGYTDVGRRWQRAWVAEGLGPFLAAAPPQARAGTLQMLAVTNAQRAEAAPEVPTVAEAGFPDMTFQPTLVFLAPAAMPAALRERIAGDVRAVAGTPGFAEKLKPLGMAASTSTPEALGQQIATVRQHWTERARAYGVQPAN